MSTLEEKREARLGDRSRNFRALFMKGAPTTELPSQFVEGSSTPALIVRNYSALEMCKVLSINSTAIEHTPTIVTTEQGHVIQRELK